jgi:pentapeptide repeat protein
LAESAHLEILRHGPKAWNVWRAQNPDQIPNLDDAALTLGERQLGPINGGPINLHSAHLRWALLRCAALSNAKFEDADLFGADLTYARLDGANFKAANLSHALLDYADLRGTILTKTNLKGTNLRYVQNLTQAQIDDSFCDRTTVFPAHLVHPMSTHRWSEGTPIVHAVEATRSKLASCLEAVGLGENGSTRRSSH